VEVVSILKYMRKRRRVSKPMTEVMMLAMQNVSVGHGVEVAERRKQTSASLQKSSHNPTKNAPP
jgi:hypothetical protein